VEALGILEKKINGLIERIKELKEENALLSEHNSVLLTENMQMKDRLESVESTLMSRHQSEQEFDQERSLTKLMVEDIIKNIDSIVQPEQQ
jgi:regulator of replication initiation timing